MRAAAVGGPQDGQVNTFGLERSKMRGYWLDPTGAARVSEATICPVNEGMDSGVTPQE